MTRQLFLLLNQSGASPALRITTPGLYILYIDGDLSGTTVFFEFLSPDGLTWTVPGEMTTAIATSFLTFIPKDVYVRARTSGGDPSVRVWLEYAALTRSVYPVVQEAASGASVPPGGGTGQFLAKTSAADFDTEWFTITKQIVGLGAVDNTSDLLKPISNATQGAFNLKAPLASPAFTGTPSAPTAALGTSTLQLATTAFVANALAALVDTAPGTLDTLNEIAAALGDDPNFAATITAQLALKAPLASPALTGVPTAPTAADGTSTTQVATTAFVTSSLSAKANTASPTFTGIPLAPTAAVDTSSTQIATTAFVLGQAGGANPLVNGTAAPGTSLRYARQDHVHPTDTSRAALASPAFTGVPSAPTASTGTNTTQIATTAFVKAALDALIGAAPGTLDTLQELADALGDDPNFAATVTSQLALKAPLASPGLTGTPTAPTAAANTNTTQLATTAFVVGQAGTASPVMNGTATVGTSLRFSREDHVHASDTSRAPLASPAFTGTPTAPTAAAGTSSTQLATTAFVTSRTGLKSSFIAHKNGTDQAISSPSTDTILTWSNEDFDLGGNFASSRWTPPAGIVLLRAQAFVVPAAGPTPVEIAIYKNGVVARKVQQTITTSGGEVAITLMDPTGGTDYYEVSIMIGGTTGTVNGQGAYTFFNGTLISGG